MPEAKDRWQLSGVKWSRPDELKDKHRKPLDGMPGRKAGI